MCPAPTICTCKSLEPVPGPEGFAANEDCGSLMTMRGAEILAVSQGHQEVPRERESELCFDDIIHTGR